MDDLEDERPDGEYVFVTARDIKAFKDRGINSRLPLLLFCKIRSFGICDASNSYFSEFLQASEREVENAFRTLREHNLITCSYKTHVVNGKYKKRRIAKVTHIDPNE